MTRRPVQEMQRQERRTQVTKLYLRGWTQQRIADEIGVTQRCVSMDLQRVRKEWAKSRVDDMAAMKLQELAGIQQVEEEAWQEWDRSKKDAEATITEEMELGGGAPAEPQAEATDDGTPFIAPIKIKTRKESRGRLADARYLQVINQCRDDRCKLLNLYPAQLPVNLDVLKKMSREQIRRVAQGEDPLFVLATGSAANGSGVAGPGDGSGPVMH